MSGGILSTKNRILFRFNRTFLKKDINATIRELMSIIVDGGPDQDRTGDPIVANDVLSQLSYKPECIYLIIETIFFQSNLSPTPSFTGKEKAIP